MQASAQCSGTFHRLKRPGIIDVDFLPDIPSGLDRKAFMAALEEVIETRMAVLDAPYLVQQEETG